MNPSSLVPRASLGRHSGFMSETMVEERVPTKADQWRERISAQERSRAILFGTGGTSRTPCLAGSLRVSWFLFITIWVVAENRFAKRQLRKPRILTEDSQGLQMASRLSRPEVAPAWVHK